MATLRTDYTDAVWTGKKKYVIESNGDGTSSITDVTVYDNYENSFFGAKDANAINDAINGKLDKVILKNISIPSTAWVEYSELFKAPLSISELTTKTKVDVNTTSEIVKTMMENGITAIYVENDNGTASAIALGNKPTDDITLSVSLMEVQEA